MMLERFGVDPPSIDSVLSFKIDGLEDMLPLKKVVIETYIIFFQFFQLY